MNEEKGIINENFEKREVTHEKDLGNKNSKKDVPYKRNDILMAAVVIGMIALITTVATMSIIYTIQGEKNVFYFGHIVDNVTSLINFIV